MRLEGLYKSVYTWAVLSIYIKCEFVSDILNDLHHKQVYLILCLLKCMDRHQNYHHCPQTKEAIAYICKSVPNLDGCHLAFLLDAFIVLLYR